MLLTHFPIYFPGAIFSPALPRHPVRIPTLPFFPQLHARQSSAKCPHSSILIFFLSPPLLLVWASSPRTLTAAYPKSFISSYQPHFLALSHLTLSRSVSHSPPLASWSRLLSHTTLTLLYSLISPLFFQSIYLSDFLCKSVWYCRRLFISSRLARTVDH